MTVNFVKMPERIAALPRDEKNRPVPFFVSWEGDKPDFRVVDQRRVLECYRDKLCFICGQRLGIHLAFVGGPLSMIQRISIEPPSHYECAAFAMQACPFLATPRMGYRDRGLPNGTTTIEEMGTHNPGVNAIWVTKSYQPFMQGEHLLVRLAEPSKVEWWTEGREATRVEVEEGFARAVQHFYEQATSSAQVERFKADLLKAWKYWPPPKKS